MATVRHQTLHGTRWWRNSTTRAFRSRADLGLSCLFVVCIADCRTCFQSTSCTVCGRTRRDRYDVTQL